MKASLVIAMALCVTGATSPAVRAQAFPTRPITIIVPASAGGPVDVRMRLLAERLSATLGQNVLVDNRAGAAGAVGAQAMTRAKPDGHTLFAGHSGTHSLAPWVNANQPYDVVRDFAPVALAYTAAYYLYVPATSPVRSVRDLLAAARAKPGAITYGSTGVGSGQHVQAALFAHLAGVELVHVPYKGSAPLVTALASGEVDMAFDAYLPGMEQVAAGRLRAIAYGRETRSRVRPDLPTVAEAGVSGCDVRVWVGLFAPAGTPPGVIAVLNRAIVQGMASPELSRNLRDTGAQTEPMTPEQFGALVRDELAKGRRLAELAGLKPE